jgi:hypothetical protein
MSATRQAIQNLLTKNKISAHVAHRMQTLYGHILRNSSTTKEADVEAERYFKGVDGHFRPFFSIIFALLLPLMGNAQTTFPTSRWEKSDSLVFQGNSTMLQVYPNQDSVVITDVNGNQTFLTCPTAVINAGSPSTGNVYGCYVFGNYGDNTIIVEFSYNPRTRLWGTCITFEGSWMLEGMAVLQPFPPLRPPPTKPKRPVTAFR